MKNLFKTMMLVAVAAMGFTACSNSDVNEVVAPSKQTKKITVIGDITRTEFNSDLSKLVWSEGDTFAVFTDVATDLNIQSSAYAADATDFGLEVDATATKVYAYYPYYSGNSSKTATEMSVGIPGTQTQSIAGQLTSGNLPMVAQGTIEGDVVALSFKPIATVLGFNIYGDSELTENIVSIKFTAAGEEKSSGYDYTYNLTNSEEVYTPAYQYTLLNLSGDAQFVPGATKAENPQAYMVVSKANYSAGVEILVTTEGGTTYTFTTTQPIDCTETYRTMNLNLSKAVKVVPEVLSGPYVSDSIFTCLTDNTIDRVYSLGESKVGKESATGFKLGTSSKTGSFTSEAVGVTGDKYLVFYGIGWTSVSGEITIKVGENTISTLTLAENNSVSGNAPYVNLNFAATDIHYVKLTGLAADDKITFSTTSNGVRAVLCGVKLSDEAPELPATLTVTPAELSFEAAGGSKTFTATLANSEEEITVTEEADWLSVTNEGTTYTVTATEYDNTEEDRIATITVKAGDLSETITVTQAKYVDPNAGGDEPGTSGNVYTKVTSTADLTDGQYLIVYEDESFAFDGSLSTLDATSNYKSVTISDNKIAVTTEMEAIEFTIGDNKTTIKSKSGNYIGRTADKNELDESSVTAYTNTITINNDGTAHIVGSRGAVLRFNTATGQDRFRYYKSSSYSSQKAITLYKKN